MEKRLMRVREIAVLLDVKEQTVRNWVFERKLPFVKVGRLVKFEPEAIQRFIEENRVERAS